MVSLSLNFLLQVKINVPSALTGNTSWTTALKHIAKTKTE